MDMRKLVGSNFARLRREKGLTQEEIEARSGFSQQYLSGLERGRRNPTVITLYELAQALDVRVEAGAAPAAGATVPGHRHLVAGDKPTPV